MPFSKPHQSAPARPVDPVDAADRLLQAVQDDDLVRLRELLEEDPARAGAMTADGRTPLQLAAYLRRHDAIRLLRAHDALQTVHEAATLGDVEALDRLLDANPDHLDRPGPDGFPPLHLSAHFAQHDALQRLLDRGADLDSRSTNANGNTALHAAAAGAAVATLRILLASGIDPDVRDAGGNTALHVAAANGAVPCVDALLDGGADREAKNERGETPADIARQRDEDEVVEILGARAMGSD